MARVRTEEMLKPGQNGVGLGGLCRAWWWWWWVMPQAVGRRAVRNSRRRFVTMAFFRVTRIIVNCKDRREGSRLLSQFILLLPFLIRSPTNFHVGDGCRRGAP